MKGSPKQVKTGAGKGFAPQVKREMKSTTGPRFTDNHFYGHLDPKSLKTSAIRSKGGY